MHPRMKHLTSNDVTKTSNEDHSSKKVVKPKNEEKKGRVVKVSVAGDHEEIKIMPSTMSDSVSRQPVVHKVCPKSRE